MANTTDNNLQKKESLEEVVIRLQAEKQTILLEKEALKEIAELSSAKLKKLEKVQTEPTVDIEEKTFKVLLKKGSFKTSGFGSAVRFQFVKNSDGKVDEGHVYPDGEQWAEILKKNELLGVLEEL